MARMTIQDIERSGVRLNESLSAARGIAKISQTSVARAIGLSGGAMTQRTKNVTQWSLSEALKLAYLFDVNLFTLLDGPGDWLRTVDPEKVSERLHSMIGDTAAYHSSSRVIAA